MAASPPICHVERSVTPKNALNSDDICERFQTSFAQAVGDHHDFSHLRVSLYVADANLIEAKLTKATDESVSVIPLMSVEVSDRQLTLKDVDDLAAVVGRAVLKQAS